MSINLSLIILSIMMPFPVLGANAFDRAPDIVLGGDADDILGNGGEPYGGEFAKIIYVDVLQFLKDQFAQNKIPATHPLHILKLKMSRFESLLQEQDRVSAVSQIVDSAGHDVLVRVAPKRSPILLKSSTSEYLETDVQLDLQSSSQNALILKANGDSPFSNLMISATSSQLSYIRLGAHPVTSDGVLLPAGARFYTVCSSDAETGITQWKTAEQVDIICGGFNLDGTVASIQGTLTRSKDASGNFVLSGKMTVQLFIQKYCIEVNRREFERLRDTAPQSTLTRLVFHEYLRLLGVNDNGNKLSMLLDELRTQAFAAAKFPTIGARAFVPAGAEMFGYKDGMILRYPQTPRSQRARFGEIASIYDVRLPTVNGFTNTRIVRIHFEETPGLQSVFYHLLNEIKSASAIKETP